MVAAKRSTGVAPEVNLRNPLYMDYEACKQGLKHPSPPFILDLDQTYTTGYGQTVPEEELPDIQIEGVFTYLTCAMILLVESVECTANRYHYWQERSPGR